MSCCKQQAQASTSCCSQASTSCCTPKPAIATEPSVRMDTSEGVKESVRDYYGKRVKKTSDLKTNTCTTAGCAPSYVRKALSRVPDEVLEKYYGCGSPLPSGIKGMNVLDLGSGSGRDCYVAASLVGEEGAVFGVDMTDEQLEIARKHADSYCRETLGYKAKNMMFYKGFIEDIKAAGVKDNSINICMSNCVVNLSPDKAAVLKGVYRALKNGGEMYFSDIYSDRRIPDAVRKNEVLWGECLSGALYVNDFLKVCVETGFIAPRVLSVTPVPLTKDHDVALLGNAKFYSILFRLFKVEPPTQSACCASSSSSCCSASSSSSSSSSSASSSACCAQTLLEPTEEDYGQIATYLGTLPDHEHSYQLDLNTTFVANKPTLVSGNTAAILQYSWLAPHFRVQGDRTNHFGPFVSASSQKDLWAALRTAPMPTKSTSSGCC